MGKAFVPVPGHPHFLALCHGSVSSQEINIFCVLTLHGWYFVSLDLCHMRLQSPGAQIGIGVLGSAGPRPEHVEKEEVWKGRPEAAVEELSWFLGSDWLRVHQIQFSSLGTHLNQLPLNR